MEEVISVAFRVNLELHEAICSYIKDEYEKSGVKVPVGQTIRKILVAFLREQGYLTTNKLKVGQRLENGQEIERKRETERAQEIGRGQIEPTKQKGGQRRENYEQSLFASDDDDKDLERRKED
jgi:hypothetical protein